MKIINRYVLNEHVGPFVFALSALTSLLLLQYIARKFGDLVGKGLSWSVIAEFMLLSIPFTLAMTLPMAMLVAVLYAFSRLASENEITALKAGGISTRGLMRPAVAAATGLAIFMLWFNDQVLPRANHELATLTTAIGQTKPTFALRPQVINTIKESQLYLRAGRIDQSTGLMTDVTIYDVSDAAKRNTIYASSARLALNPNMRDMTLRLYTGMMISAPTNQPGQLNRVYYKQALRQVHDVAGSFKPIDADTTSKGDREMSVCEMQRQYERANDAVQRAQYDSLVAAWRIRDVQGHHVPAPKPPAPVKAGGIGAIYCALITRYFRMNELHAAELPRQDTTKRAPAPVKPAKPVKSMKPVKPPAAAIHGSAVPGTTAGAGIVRFPPTPASLAPSSGMSVGNQMELTDAHLRLDDARYRRNRAGVEIQKKFSLAFACIVFVLVGAPLAVRFPRGGVGLVIGASFLIFAIYYIGLIGGEALSDKNIISPFWAMWTDNVIFLVAGLLLMTRMGRESGTGRGGGIGEIFEGVRGWFARQGRRLGATPARRVDD